MPEGLYWAAHRSVLSNQAFSFEQREPVILWLVCANNEHPRTGAV